MASVRLTAPRHRAARRGAASFASLAPPDEHAIKKGAEDAGTSAGAGEPYRPGLRGTLERIFGIDLRALALFRICLGLILIGDLLYRAPDLEAHYTDAGVLPIALVSVYQLQHWYWTIHTLHPAAPLVALLFLIAGLVALSLLIGYRTRTMSVLSWLLLISLQNRNTMVLTGGDTMLRTLLFWAMFLPMGQRWSVDRALDRTGAPMPERVFSMGSIALIVQLASVYLFGALLKTGPTWRTDYTAIYYALSIDQFTTPIAKMLLHYPDTLKPLTFLAWHLELFAPLLILASAFSWRLRVAVVFLYMGFHVALGLCLELGLFPAIGALAWTVLLPGPFWQAARRLRSRVRLPLALSAIAARTAPLRERLRPQSVSVRLPAVVQCVVALFLVYVTLWNVRTLDFTRHSRWFPATWNWIAELTRMDQSWELFAPDPMMSHGWLVAPAVLKDGTEVDLKTMAPVDWNPPPLISATYYNERWRKYLMNISDGGSQNQCFTYASYLGNRWNNSHSADQRVKSVKIVYVHRTALPHYRLTDYERTELFDGAYP